MNTIHAGLLVCVLMKLVEAVPLASFYSFGPSAGDTTLHRNDDQYSSLISLSTEFSYFGTNYDAVYVNNNGVVSFDAPVSTFTPEAFPINGSRVLLSPYWADVDTRPSNGGFVYYRQSTDSILLTKAMNQVHTLFPAFSNFTPTFLFIATWDHVGYFNRHTDKNNTFQCVMITDGTNSFVAFLYADGLIQWTTGDASGGSNGFGGTEAQGGFNAGDGIRFFSINDSQTAAIVNIETTSNVGVPGLWMFRVDQNALSTPSAPPDIDECALGTHDCSPNADCIDTMQNYTCICRSGFTGDGRTCTVVLINECALGLDNCDFHAVCTDTTTSFECACQSGYSGDGRICTGEGDIRFSLNGTTYENNSIVMLEDIGEGGNALVCLTDLTACCRPPYTNSAMGNWFFPNGTRVPSSGQRWEIHRTRGHMKVLMQRRRGGVTGVYHCVIPDALNVIQTIYIGIYTATSLPMPPTNLRVTLINSTSVTISWQAPPPVSTVTIASYRLVVSETQFGLNDTVASSTTTSYTFTGLEEYNNYTCSIVAVSTYDVISTETAISFTTPQGEPSDVPRDIVVSAVDARSVQLTWAPPPPQHWNGIIIGYVIRVIGVHTDEDYQTNSTSMVIRDLHPFYTYRFSIAAQTVAVGPFSNPIALQMPEAVPTSPPQNARGVSVNSTFIQLTWEPPVRDGRNGIITSYYIDILEVPTSRTFTFERPSHTDLLIGLLHPYYDYQCSVAADTSVGRGPFTAPFIIRTDQDAPSGPPLNVTTRAVNSTTIQVTWAPPTPEHQNGIITLYNIDVTVSETKSNFILNTSTTSLNVTGLHPHYTYTLAVSAVTIRPGPYSELQAINTPEDYPTGVPQNVIAGAASSTSITLRWEAPLAYLQNGIIRSYRISVVELETGRVRLFTTNNVDRLLVVNLLHPFYTYNCTIAAYTIGRGPSISVSVQTLPEEPSDVPRDIVVSAVDARSVQLSWAPPPPQHWNGIIIGYVIRVIGVHTDEDYHLPLTNGTSMVIENLHPFYTYRFFVAAQTVAVGPFSNPIALQMPEAAPSAGAVEQITVDVVSSISVNVSWLPTSQDKWNGVITHYTVEYKLIRSVRDNSGVAPTMYASIPALGQPLANSPNPTLVTLPLKRESVLISGLHEFSVYQFTIYYENAVGRSDSSSPLEQATSAAAPSGPPTDVVATALSATTVSVSWQPPALLDQNGVITAYQVVLVDTSDGSRKMSSVDGNTLTLLFEGLNEYTTFRVSVAANNSFGIGPYSQSVEVKTQESTPGRPTNLIRIIQDKTSVRLGWSKPDDPNGIILGYQVFYYGYTGNHTKSNQPIEILDEERSLTVGPNTTSVVINNLEPGLRYDFKVRAKTSIGYGANSSALTVTLSDAQTGSVTSGISGTTIIVVAIVGLVLLVILVLIVVVAVIYRMCRKRGKFKIDTRRTNTESNIYDTVPRLEFLNALTLESETPKKGVETEFGHATVEVAPKFDELCDKDTIEKTMPNAYFPEDMTCN